MSYFEPHKAVESILDSLSFDSASISATGSYLKNDLVYEFNWESNKSGVIITFFTSEPICTCSDGGIGCECEWDWFTEEDVYENTYFSKAKVERIRNSFNQGQLNLTLA